MSESPYSKDEQNNLYVLWEDNDGRIPLVGLFPTKGGIAFQLIGDSWDKLEAIANDLSVLKNANNGSAAKAKTPFIKQLNLWEKDTQYIFTFPIETKKFSVRNRGFANDPLGTIRYAYVQNLVALPTYGDTDSFGVLNPTDVLIEENINFTQETTMYFASDFDNVPLTIEYWV